MTPPAQPDPKPGQGGKWKLNAAQLTAILAKGGAVLDTDQPFNELILPGSAASLLQGQPLTVNAADLKLTLPAGILQAASGKVPADQLEGSTIRLAASRASETEAAERVAKAGQAEGAVLRAGSSLFTLNLSLISNDGQVHPITALQQPITLELPVASGLDAKLTGLYGLNSLGVLTYIGGTAAGGKLIAEVSSLDGAYAVLEYAKSFADTSGHWASGVIRELAAKHLIDGVGGGSFAPDQPVTRAEMAAMLVRLLHLKGDGSAPFTDVPSAAWYAEAVAAAAKAGIVQGVSGASFAPDALIKRQEAAAMIVRAYRAAGGTAAAGGGTAPFTDVADSPAWAQEAVRSAYAAGLIQGQGPNRFHPDGQATRAETAQILYNVLAKLGQAGK